MKKLIMILVCFILFNNLEAQSKSVAEYDYYGEWKLIAMKANNVNIGIEGEFIFKYNYSGGEDISHGQLSFESKIVSLNCITKYTLENKGRGKFIQRVTETEGSDCGETSIGDSLIADYSVSGEYMTIKAYSNSVKVTLRYKRIGY